ncbi:TetR/AcrR family transcriptional regulator [Streptomyces sp. NPDC001941]|uniref:TetR/AcrR family transcriptional regulator n=1 Tax=Streptomyces sp. NPDC001941 TaxID=3154659 RepID=UPI0033277470
MGTTVSREERHDSRPSGRAGGPPGRGRRGEGGRGHAATRSGPARPAGGPAVPADGAAVPAQAADTGPPRRGRPRSEAVEQAILEGAIKLLEEGVPLADVSIERIARTAGVGKATIYRRWPGKEALFVDLLRSIEPTEPPLPGTSVREDLIVLLQALRRRGLAKRSSALLHNVFAQMQSYPTLWDAYHRTVIEPRRKLSLDVLRRGVETGEIRGDVDIELVNDLFTGPMLVRTVIRPVGPIEEDLPERIVDSVLAGVRPRD